MCVVVRWLALWLVGVSVFSVIWSELLMVIIYGHQCTNLVDEPTSCLMQHIGAHGGGVMYFVYFCFRGEIGFLDFDDICMCVVNKLFELLKFVLIPFMLT